MNRHLKEASAAALIAGGVAGGLVGCSTESVEAKPVPSQTNQDTQQSSVIDQIIGYSPESAPDTPKNRARRCIFATGQAAILDVMRSPNVSTSSIAPGQLVYRAENQSEVIVDTSTPGKAILDYEVYAGDGDFSARGLITIPVEGSVDESLDKVDARKLHESYEIEDRSAVFNLQENTGSTAKKAYAWQLADETCEVAEDFIESVQK